MSKPTLFKVIYCQVAKASYEPMLTMYPSETAYFYENGEGTEFNSINLTAAQRGPWTLFRIMREDYETWISVFVEEVEGIPLP